MVKQIASEGNSLYSQGGAPTGINVVEGEAFADPAQTALLASRDSVINEVSVGMSGDEGAMATAFGTPPLSLPNSLGKPLTDWKVDLLPYQEGTGDPAPDNVRPIHGTDKVTVWTSGTNVWNEEWEAGRYNPSTGAPTSEPGIRSKNFIPVFAGNSYYLYCGSITTNDFRILYYDKNYTFLSATSWLNPNTVISITTASYIKFYTATAYGNVYKNDIAFNFPSTITTYSPYVGSSSVITLPTTIYNGSVSDDGAVSNWGVVDLGDLTFSASTFASTYHSFRITNLRIAPPSSDSDPIHAICNCLKSLDYGSSWTPNSIAPNTSGSDLIRVIVPTDINTVEELKALLAGMQIVYELPAPVSFTLTTPDIPTPTGTATAWATAEDGTVDGMEVTYVGKA